MMNSILKKLFADPATEYLPVLEKGAVILDVRTPVEFNGGHAEGAINMPLNELGARINEIKAMGKPVLAYCRSGMRSGTATNLLIASGVEAYNVGSLGDMNTLLLASSPKPIN